MDKDKEPLSHLRQIIKGGNDKEVEMFLQDSFELFVGNSDIMKMMYQVGISLNDKDGMINNYPYFSVQFYKVFCNSPTIVVEIIVSEDYKVFLSKENMSDEERLLLTLDSKNKFATEEEIKNMKKVMDKILSYCKLFTSEKDKDYEIVSLYYTTLIDMAYNTKMMLHEIGCEGLYHEESREFNIPPKIASVSECVLQEACEFISNVTDTKSLIDTFCFINKIEIIVITKDGEEFKISIGIKTDAKDEYIAGTVFVEDEFDNKDSFISIFSGKSFKESLKDIIDNSDIIKEVLPNVSEISEDYINNANIPDNVLIMVKDFIFEDSISTAIHDSLMLLISTIKKVKGTDKIAVKFKGIIHYYFRIKESFIDDIIMNDLQLKEVE